jgi:hypothetical protein
MSGGAERPVRGDLSQVRRQPSHEREGQRAAKTAERGRSTNADQSPRVAMRPRGERELER